jgi:hypothetical protein
LSATSYCIELLGLSKTYFKYPFTFQISGLWWDHANSEVKIEVRFGSHHGKTAPSETGSDTEEQFIILTMAISVELEGELKLRLAGLAASTRGIKVPPSMYVGIFAGDTKPKPFQRKRPNLSDLPTSKLPPLGDMRSTALQLHKGSYRPCPPGESRRLELAIQHIFEGHNTFPLLSVSGHAVMNQWRPDSVLQIREDMLVFRPLGATIGTSIEFSYTDIADWSAMDSEGSRMNESGIQICSQDGDTVFFGVPYIRDAKHTLEFFWNTYQVANGGHVKLGSTHGRPIVSVATLSGDMHPPEPPRGLTEVVDQDGILVRPGSRMMPRNNTITSVVINSKEPKVVPQENRDVKKHWHKVVMHQGWLLKKGTLLSDCYTLLRNNLGC